ncbi:MAG TPA: NAD(P)-dependent oxidoreductase, partial [Gammaproteobacteria bacterium]|nr:NAD(P)-dependent oxidoreductase [Gammaproteobacteria bacterium]
MTRFNRLLITGAAGKLGRELRRGLAPLAQTLRLSDRADMEPAGENE